MKSAALGGESITRIEYNREKLRGHRSIKHVVTPSSVRFGSKISGESEADFGHLDFRSFSNHSVATSRAKIRAKMAAPVKADVRMSRRESP